MWYLVGGAPKIGEGMSMTKGFEMSAGRDLPAWVPEAVCHYLAHTEDGLSIRALARATDCHPSTILRQVRRFEGRRDDPLVDAALNALASHRVVAKKAAETKQMFARPAGDQPLSQDCIDQEAKRVLRRMCEPRAVLAIAREMETAVVAREDDSGETLRTASVDREIAQAMALKEWIASPDGQGRVRRYFITNSGRAALRRLTAADDNRANGLSETSQEDTASSWEFPREMDGMRSRARYYASESPLLGLARRKDKDGEPFLNPDLVKAGERLREDFELAQITGPAARSFEAFMTKMEEVDQDGDSMVSQGARDARARVHHAMTDLGAGLGDVAMRCCCLLEGMEVTEKALGWSARSGKIVLRIALQRLRRHYLETQGEYGPMIG